MTIILLILLLNSPDYSDRKQAMHNLKVSTATFSQLVPVYKHVDVRVQPEIKLNLKDVLYHKFIDEKLTFYFPSEEYIYPSEKERLLESMNDEFRRLIR